MSKANQMFQVQTLMYIAQLSSEENFREALEMGLTAEQVEIFRNMTMESINELASCLQAHVMSIAVDPIALDMALTIMDRRQKERKLIMALVKAGACFPAMQTWFGMRPQEFVSYRKLLGIAGDDAGRVAKPSERTQNVIWEAWRQSNRSMEAERYLDVHQATGVAIRVLWDLFKEWEATGIKQSLDNASKFTSCLGEGYRSQQDSLEGA